ncbi:MAG: hypothetical protein WCJ59_03180, partial [bacterium]
MNAQTQTWVGPRDTYYNVTSVPYGILDGIPIKNCGSAYVGAPACLDQAQVDWVALLAPWVRD